MRTRFSTWSWPGLVLTACLGVGCPAPSATGDDIEDDDDRNPGSGARDADAIAPAAYRDAYGAYCDFIARCPEDGPVLRTRDRDECIDVLYFVFTCRVDRESDDASIARATIDASAAELAACVAYLDGLGCGDLECVGDDCNTPERLACSAVFTLGDDLDVTGGGDDGGVNDDGACRSDDDCGVGTHCRAPTYDDVAEQSLCAACVAPLVLNETCTFSGVPCAPGTHCRSFENIGLRCQPPAGVGDTCSGHEQCISGFCSGGTCREGGEIGDDCIQNGECRTLYCFNESCAEQAADGEPCALDTACLSFHCDVDDRCGIPDGGTCRGFFDPCRSGFCNEGTGQCQVPTVVGEGERCDAGDGIFCADGFACDFVCVRSCTEDVDCGGGDRCDTEAFPARCRVLALEGEPCDRDEACASEICTDNDVCGSPPAPGAPCSGFDCGESLACVAGACVARSGPGEACGSADGCFSPYLCVAGTCELIPLTCAPAPAGERCAGLQVCADDAFCDFTADITCASRKAVGEACIGFPADECDDGAFCNRGEGRCAVIVPVGGACTDDGSCGPGHRCLFDVCEAVLGPCDGGNCPGDAICDDEVCIARRQEGEACDSRIDCTDGTVCRDDRCEALVLPGVGEPCADRLCGDDAFCFDGATCSPRLVAGDSCNFSDECQGGLFCIGVCTAPQANGAFCNDDNGEVECASGICDSDIDRCVAEAACLESAP